MKRILMAQSKVKTVGKTLLMIALCFTLTGCSTQTVDSKATTMTAVKTKEPTEEVTAVSINAPTASLTATPTAKPTAMPPLAPAESPYEFVNVSCITLKVPTELNDKLVHKQSTHGQAVTEAFYMKIGDAEELPLYRIDVGDENLGDWLGMLKTENGNVPITYTVFTVTEEQFAALGDGAADTYAELMNAFNVMLEDILSDVRFTVEKPLAVGEDSEVQMTYWTVTLPSNMSFIEAAENGNYHAVFSGNVQGEKVDLYTVHIGDDKAVSELGLFEIDGVKKPISVGSFDLTEKPNWTEDDYSAAYRMMDTINHVIETIMSSAQFSIPSEESVQAPNAAQ